MCGSNDQVVNEVSSLGFVIPTRNRPEKLRRTLEALASQTIPGLRVVVIASGEDVATTTVGFERSLRLTYRHTENAGQIAQRNAGILQLLAEGVQYVGFLDDDIIFEPRCVEALLEFISGKQEEGETAIGVGLNITNVRHFTEVPFLGIRRLLRRVGPESGRMTSIGMNTGIANTKTDIQSQWLGGGYTVWSAEILERFPQREIRTKHAAGEDLIYSYPIGKEYRLFVCAAARIAHEDTDDSELRPVRYLTKRATIAHLYFIAQYHEFSTIKFLVLSLIYQTLILAVPKRRGIAELLGFIDGCWHYFRRHARDQDVLSD